VKQPTVEAWLAALEPGVRADLDALRAVVSAADPGLVEEIKWNAPSYARDGEDRVTLGLNPKGGFRMVLHRGAKTLDTEGFAFADDDRLAKWPAKDRGVVTLGGRAEIDAKGPALTRLVARWVEAAR
jgi:hypothetical protein